MSERLESVSSPLRRALAAHFAFVLFALFAAGYANATSIKSCEAASLPLEARTQSEELAKTLVAPDSLDERKSFYCKQGKSAIAFFQAVPVRARDGALETKYVTCSQNAHWNCALSRERSINVASSLDVRLATRDDLSAEKLRDLYSAAMRLAENGSSNGGGDCHTSGDQAKKLRERFLSNRPDRVEISEESAHFTVQRDHIELRFSLERDSNGVEVPKYHCIVEWPSSR